MKSRTKISKMLGSKVAVFCKNSSTKKKKISLRLLSEIDLYCGNHKIGQQQSIVRDWFLNYLRHAAATPGIMTLWKSEQVFPVQPSCTCTR